MARSSVARLPGIDVPAPVERDRARRRWSPGAAWAALAGFLGCELALVFLVAAEPSPLAPVTRAEFGRAVAGPFAGLAEDVAESPMAHRWAFAGLMLVMALCYGVLAKHADRFPGRRSLAAVGVAGVVIVLGPPLRLTDAFNYLDFARLGVLHGLNPYVHAPADAVNDPFLKLASWHRQPTSYGPLFTLLTYPLALLGVTGAIWTLKALTVAAAVAAAGLLGACARRLGQSPARAVILFGLNPIILVYGLGGIHNDFFMVLGLIGAIYLVLAGRGGAGGWAAVSAVGLKASAAIVAPFVAVGSTWRRRTVLGMLVAAA